MVVFEKYCDKCGMPDSRLANVNGRKLCPKCRGLKDSREEELKRKEKLRKLWSEAKE